MSHFLKDFWKKKRYKGRNTEIVRASTLQKKKYQAGLPESVRHEVQAPLF